MSRAGLGAPVLMLASASPRRRDLLRGVGIEPTVVPAGIDESARPGESPESMVERLAIEKAEAVMKRLAASADGATDTADESGVSQGLEENLPSVRSLHRTAIVAADTTIDLDGRALGKPEDMEEARSMLERLSGRSHAVATGVAAVGYSDGEASVVSCCERTSVVFRKLTNEDISWYLRTGESDGKAGGYAIQGFGSLLVERIEGSYHNVVGLPLVALDQLLAELGWSLRQFGTSTTSSVADASAPASRGVT